MHKENTIEASKSTDFYKQLFKKVILTTSIVIASSLSYTIWTVVDSDNIFLPFLIVSLAFFKTIFIVKLTFTQLSKIIGESHQLTHVLTLFGILFILIVLSFSADYQALYVLNSENFKFETIPNNSFFLQFFEFLYFSFITFSSVGYGDIVPISIAGKIIVILEVVLSFFVLVFGISNINRIHINK